MKKFLGISLLLLLVIAPAASAQDDTAAHRALIERFYQQVYNEGNTSLIPEIVAEDYVDHGQPRWSSRDDIAHIVNTLHSRLPDLQVTIHYWYFKADYVVVHVLFTGTLDSQAARWSLMDAYRIEDGKIAEARHMPLAGEWGGPSPNLRSPEVRL